MKVGEKGMYVCMYDTRRKRNRSGRWLRIAGRRLSLHGLLSLRSIRPLKDVRFIHPESVLILIPPIDWFSGQKAT